VFALVIKLFNNKLKFFEGDLQGVIF